MMINKIIGHFKTIMIHKYYVFKYCCMAGIPIRGILHDMSKFSPTEFLESVNYYTDGKRSPIGAAREDKGYSRAWLHHRGRNDHHYEYWVYTFNDGDSYPVKMPYKCAVELVCDYFGAAHAYMGKEYADKKEFDYWLNQSKKIEHKMHPETFQFVDTMIRRLCLCNDERKVLNKDRTKRLYKYIHERNSTEHLYEESTI